ncbi:MAG: pitrilysin family protein [Mariprofundaceae bacterium]|nr:pitrilysin family protein [Mariprofundaceae bacterium]
MHKKFSKETQLSDGPMVISHAMPEAQSVALGIFIDAGSRDESASQAGISHALEHMLFKGTKSLNVHALSEKLDVLGGNANAFTSRERTCFYLHVLHEDWQEGLALLMDMLLESSLPEDEWQREREVIFSEMAMVDDTPDEWVYDQHLKEVFANHALGEPTLGKRDVLAALSTTHLRDYLDAHYCPPRLLITAAGRIEHQALVDAVAKRTWGSAVERSPRKQALRKKGAHYLSRDMEQAHIVVSFPSINAAAEHRPESWLANQMLGGGMSSALFREIRERRGLAYSVGSHLSPFSDVGLWSMSCGTHPNMLADCLAVLQETLCKFPDMINDAVLVRAKRQMEVQFRMGMDSVEGHMLYLGGRLDEDKLLSQQQWVDRIQQLQSHDIRHWVEQQLHADALWTIAGSDEALCSARAVM